MKNIIPYIGQSTMAQFAIHGRMTGRTYEPYEAPVYRRGHANEVVQLDGRYWRLVFDGRRFTGNEDVTDIIQEYHKSLLLEAQIRAVHGDLHARMMTGSNDPVEALVAPLGVN